MWTTAATLPSSSSSSARDEDAALAELTVDAGLVRALVASGAANEIVAEQEQKRQQHREHMVLYRRVKKSALESMRVEEKALTRRLKSLLRLRAINGPATSGHLASEAAVRSPPTLSMLAEVLAAKERLRQESLALRRRWGELQYLEDVVRCAGTENQSDAETAGERASPPCDDAGGGWRTFLEDEPPFYYVPFAERECRALERENAHRVFGLQAKDADDERQSVATVKASAQTQESTAVSFFDWRVHIGVEWSETLKLSVVRYKFRKTFRLPMRSLDGVVDRMWEVIHSPALFQTIQASPVRLMLLQSWADNLSVALWNTPSPDRSQKSRTTSLFSRSAYTNPQGEECVLLMINGVDLKPPPHTPSSSATTRDGEQVVFSNHMKVYNMIKHGKEDGSVEIEHGGRIEVLDEAMGRYLMVELGCSLVRLENLVLPMRVLQNDTA